MFIPVANPAEPLQPDPLISRSGKYSLAAVLIDLNRSGKHSLAAVLVDLGRPGKHSLAAVVVDLSRSGKHSVLVDLSADEHLPRGLDHKRTGVRVFDRVGKHHRSSRRWRSWGCCGAASCRRSRRAVPSSPTCQSRLGSPGCHRRRARPGRQLLRVLREGYSLCAFSNLAVAMTTGTCTDPMLVLALQDPDDPTTFPPPRSPPTTAASTYDPSVTLSSSTQHNSRSVGRQVAEIQ